MFCNCSSQPPLLAPFRTILRNLLVAYYISMPGMQPFSCVFVFCLGLRLRRCFSLGGRRFRISSIERPMLQGEGVDDAEQTDECDDFSQHHE